MGEGENIKPIKLTKKESREITEKLKKAGMPVKRDIKEIKFHKSFDKGMRLALCKNCGYPAIFIGLPLINCDCKKPKAKVYPTKKLEKFILDLQDIYWRVRK